MSDTHITEHREPVRRLSRDLRQMAERMSDEEARLTVDAYYAMQGQRIAADNQMRSLGNDGEPVAILDYLGEQSRVLENQVKGALNRYATAHPIGERMMSVKGVGPVIAAGMLAHLSVELDGRRVETVSAWWRFAGLDPSAKWQKGQKRPWNAALKTLCWKLGESFVKVSGDENAFYAQVYAQRKAFETERNETGENQEEAERLLSAKNWSKSTEAYKALSVGKLPQAQIHARAKRYAVKLFLSHLHQVMYEHRYGEAPPKPYAFAVQGHAKYIPPQF